MPLYRDQGVVLRTHRLGEADRIVSLLTEGRGKVRAVAKGVRRTKSKFGARLEPMSHVALQLYEGRGELDTITQVETIETFRAAREDFDRVTKVGALLEVVDQVSQEGEPNPNLYRMLLGALRSLVSADSPLLVAGFYWKLLSQESFHPVLDVCASCGADGPLVAFELSEGGALCRSCRRGAAVAVTSEALALLREILGGGLARALKEPPSQVTAEVEDLAIRAVEAHLERRLRTARAWNGPDSR